MNMSKQKKLKVYITILFTLSNILFSNKIFADFYSAAEDFFVNRLNDLVKNEFFYEARSFYLASNDILKEGKTVLMAVAERNYFNLLKFLIEFCQADVRKLDVNGRSVIHYAARSGSLKMIDYFNSLEIDLLCTSSEYNPLQETISAINSGSNSKEIDKKKKLVLYFIDKFPDLINRPDKNGIMPLTTAAATGDVQLCKELVLAGANVKYIDKKGRNLIHQLITQWIKKLNFGSLDKQYEKRRKNFFIFSEGLSFFVANGVDINHRDIYEITPLLLAGQYTFYPEIFVALWHFGALLQDTENEKVSSIISKRLSAYDGPYTIEYYEYKNKLLNQISNFLNDPILALENNSEISIFLKDYKSFKFNKVKKESSEFVKLFYTNFHT